MTYTDPGMDQMMSVEDCGLYITTRKKGKAGVKWDQKTAIAVIKDVSFTGAENRVYRKTWGSRRNRFYVRGDEKVTGKFTFEAITPTGWDLLRSRKPKETESYLEISGTFTDAAWTKKEYIFTLYQVHIDQRDFSMSNATGPGDMPFTFTAEYVDTDTDVYTEGDTHADD
jgi:hypothetical protein